MLIDAWEFNWKINHRWEDIRPISDEGWTYLGDK